MTETKTGKWKRRRQTGGHITLPSGEQIRIEVPNLVDMLAAGSVPNELVRFAVEITEQMRAGIPDLDMEKVKEAASFMHWVISATVKDPEITPEDVPELPTEDAEMIMEFAMRQRVMDAVGHHLHGLETLPSWRKFHFGSVPD